MAIRMIPHSRGESGMRLLMHDDDEAYIAWPLIRISIQTYHSVGFSEWVDHVAGLNAHPCQASFFWGIIRYERCNNSPL